MMAEDPKRLSEAGRPAWIDRAGEVINIDRAWQKSDRRIALRRREQALLAAAGMDGPEAHWYVLRIENGLDKTVENSLTEAKVEHWMAVTEVMPKRRGKRKHQKLKPVSVPALPGYIFVRVVSCAACWEGLRTIKGVIEPIGGALFPQPVREQEITKLQAFIEKDPDAIAVLTNALKVGDTVTIDTGPFASFPGVVVEVDGDARAMLEVMIFGRAVACELDLASITKVD